MKSHAWLSAAFVALSTLACSGGGNKSSGGAGGDPTVFLAFAPDFRGYHSWQSYDVTNDADLAGIHDGSTVIEYINHLPPSGATEFPIATIIVKEATGGTISHELFAMVKRGGGYNAALPGWEWFDLENLNDGKDSVKIDWYGFGPPNGTSYGGDAGSTCNTCHLACNNDGVCATPLNLSNF